MRNGCVLPTPGGLETIAAALDRPSDAERDQVRQRLRIGLQWDAEVTLPGAGHAMSLVYFRRRRSALNRCFLGWWAAVRSAIHRMG